MRAIVQRVRRAQVTVAERVVGEIGRGLLILLGVGKGDDPADGRYLAAKIDGLRIFEDPESRKMTRSLADIGGEALVVSQFTLFGDVRRGRRPSFDDAAPPEDAKRLYESFCEELRRRGAPVHTGEFQAMMEVELVNEGPVTILLDSKKLF